MFWSQAFQSYVMFDDKRVSNLGTWAQVVERCTKGKLQPTVILYEAADPRVAAKLEEDCAAADAADAARVEREKQEALKLAATNAAAASPSPPSSVQTQPSASPAAPAAAASAALSPQTANNNAFFNSHAAGGQPHIISAPVTSASSVVTAASSSPAPSRASTGSASSSSDHSMSRQPPAVIPSYFGGSSNASGDQKDADEADYERTVWAAQQIGAGSSSSSASPAMHPASSSPPPFGFAGPSQSARNLALLQQAAAAGSPHAHRPWVCLGCNQYFSSSVAFGQCPRCVQPAAAAQPQQRSAEQIRHLEMQRVKLAAGHGFTVRR